MKKKIVFKSMLTLMTVSILPFSNFGVFAQPSQSTSSPKTAVSGLSKTLKLPSVFADDSTPANETNSNGLVPTTSEPQKSVTAPARPTVATNPYTEAMAPSSFGYQSSINGLPNVASGQISVIAGTSSVFNATVSDANVQAALAYINANGSSSTDYVLFIGGSVTLSSTTTGNSGNAGSFSGLAGHAKSLTIVSNTADSLTSSTTAAASGNATITYNQSFYLGVPTVIRNATLAQSSDALYAQGNAFATTVGSSITGGPAIYGGNDGNSNLSSDTNIYLGAYGAGTWNIYGGDDTGSGSATLTGNTHVSIAGLNGPSINNLSGGNNTGGIINGNTSLSLTKFGGTVSNIYGAGVGSSSAYVKLMGTLQRISILVKAQVTVLSLVVLYMEISQGQFIIPLWVAGVGRRTQVISLVEVTSVILELKVKRSMLSRQPMIHQILQRVIMDILQVGVILQLFPPQGLPMGISMVILPIMFEQVFQQMREQCIQLSEVTVQVLHV